MCAFFVQGALLKDPKLQRIEDIASVMGDRMWVSVFRIGQCNEAQPEINIGPLKGVLVALSRPGLRADGDLVQVLTKLLIKRPLKAKSSGSSPDIATKIQGTHPQNFC